MEICELGQKKYRPQNKYYFDKDAELLNVSIRRIRLFTL